MLLIGLSCLMALKCLGRAYARKQLTELMVLFTAVWAISLLFQALSAASEMGRRGVVMLLPLAWIPLAIALNRHLLRARCGRPPTLLVLRVFQHEAQVQSLFDHVVERWRLSGNTSLIAGTDLPARPRARSTPTAAFASTSATATTAPGSSRSKRWCSAATWC